MAFEYKKLGKLQDHLEAEATDWIESYIKDLHGVNDSVELTKEQINKQQEGMKKVCASSDIVITTAQVFGRPAPTLVTKEMVSVMSPGSVIVDMAVGTGGNVEGSIPDQITEVDGVKIIGNTNLPGELPVHSSQVYASNIYNLIEEFWDEETKELTLDEKDEILSICLVSHKKEYINPTIKEIMQ